MKLLLVGFSEKEAEDIENALGIPVLAVPEQLKGLKVEELLKAESEGGELRWTGEKFLIMDGLDNEGIKRVIETVRRLSKERVIFATTTETNLKWTLEELLEELRAEDEYFRALKEARKQVKERKGLFLNIGNVK
ncbi:DUF3783 domain-containing protein [Thermococcus sp.]|uniref:DUF3783 domain-containing protein n=1 Tax=Thermococcus sp. TaxID=35749 RepID=UPI002602AE0C|nr:DUF3783 domain-containing protein [Thermococcus sp.]